MTATPTPDTTEGVFGLVTGLWRSNECRPANGLLTRAGRWGMLVLAASATTHAKDGAVCPRWALRLYGAVLSIRLVNETDEWLVQGLVPDRVQAVRVDGRDAVLASNTFLVQVPQYPEHVVLVETDSERTIAIPSLPRLPDTG